MRDHMSRPVSCLQHGGNLTDAKATFDYAGQWLDLSTGINPHAYRLSALDETVWQRLPDADLATNLYVAAASYFGVSTPDCLLAAPGTQSLLQMLPRVLVAKKVAIVAPTYNEHARCWARAGAEVIEIEALSEIPIDADIVVVVNPNNPDGNTYRPDVLNGIALNLAERGGFLIIDEAFCDVQPEQSLASQGGCSGLLILRSFGKFFGLAGVRLGFVVAPESVIARLNDEQGPWAVSGPALEIGTQAYADHQWIAQTRRRLSGDIQRLRLLLDGAGLRLVGGTDLFVLVDHPEAPGLWKHLATQGIWTRPFDYNPSWLRFGLPGSKDDWRRLSAALGCWPT